MVQPSSGQLSYMDNRVRMLGMNGGFDTQALLEAQLQIMELKDSPLLSQKDIYSEERRVWESLKSNLTKFETLTNDIKRLTAGDKKVTLSQEGSFTMTANNKAIEGNYTIDVQSVAAQNKIKSDYIGDANSPLNKEGTVQINKMDLTLTKEMTLNDLANKINTGDYKADAVIIGGHLVITSRISGSEGALSFTDGIGVEKIATSSDETTISAKITGEPLSGTNNYSIAVEQLAEKQMVKSNAVIQDEMLNTTGNFTLNGVTFTVNETDTISSVIDKINENSTVGVRASINQNNELVFEGEKTGSTNSFTLTDATTDGTTSLFQKIGMLGSTGDFNNVLTQASDAKYTIDGVSKTSETNKISDIQGVEYTLHKVNTNPTQVTIENASENILASMGVLNLEGQVKNTIQQATDAKVTIDGIELTSSNNTISDAITGVTLELIQPTVTTVTSKIENDQSELKEKVKQLVSEYNKTILNINQLTGKEAILQGQSIPNRIKMSMNMALMGKTNSDLLMYEVGIQLNGDLNDGTIKLDEAKLDQQIEGNLDEVLKLFTGEDSFTDVLYDRIREATKETGTISSTVEGLGKRIESIDKQLERNQVLYETERQTLLRKYASFESMMSSLNFQSDYMSAQLEALNGGNNKK